MIYMRLLSLTVFWAVLISVSGCDSPTPTNGLANRTLQEPTPSPKQRQEPLFVTATGYGSSHLDAIHDAWRNAIETVVGALVSAHTTIENESVIDDDVLLYSNGWIVSYEEFEELQRVNMLPNGDTQFVVQIGAYISTQLIFEKLLERHTPFESDSSLANIDARITTQRHRDKSAIDIITESMDLVNYPLGVWKIKPTLGIRESGTRTDRGEEIIIVPVEFKYDKNAWAIFSRNLSNALKHVCSKQELLFLDSKPMADSPFFVNSLEELQIPHEKRAFAGDTWGAISVAYDPVSITLMQNATEYLSNAIPTSLGAEDVIVVIGNNLELASAYAVSSKIFDTVWLRTHQLPVARLTVPGGRQLTLKKFQAPNYIHGHVEVLPNVTYILQNDASDFNRTKPFSRNEKSPRTLYLAPFIACEIGCPTTPGSGRKNIKFLTNAFTFDYKFSIPKGKLHNTDISIQIEGLDCITERLIQ
jgi:hypothetical protein